MWQFIRKLARRLLFGLGVAVILLALAVGAFRVVIAQVPGYQTELRAWVARELGVDADFDELDARLGLRGPELTLRRPSLRWGGIDQPFFEAEEASITVDAWQLLLERRVAVARITLDRGRVTVERSESGAYHLQGLPAEPQADLILAELLPEPVSVVVRDSQLLYIDRPQRRSWQFVDLSLTLESAPDRIAVEARARPPTELADLIELSFESGTADRGTGSREMHLTGEFSRFDLGAARRLLPPRDGVPIGGTGDIGIDVRWADDGISQATIAADLGEVRIGDEAHGATYDALGFDANWDRRGPDGWRLSLADLSVSRDGRTWQPDGTAVLEIERDLGELSALSLGADFVRLEDLGPFVGLFEEAQLAEQWAIFEPRGDVSELAFSLSRSTDAWEYELAGRFYDLGVVAVGAEPGIGGLSGSVRASASSGTLEFDSPEITVDWPEMFRGPVQGRGLRGAIVWRQGREGVRVISDNLRIEVLGEEVVSSFDLSVPQDTQAAYIDLEARMPAVDLVAAKRFLPINVLPPEVLSWLDDSVQGGQGRNIELDFFGPLDAFPFDGGEGQFRVQADVTDATLAYIPDWPAAEALDGRLDFLNAGFRAEGAGRILGNVSDDIEVAIADMRSPVLTIDGSTTGGLSDVLEFFRDAPLIARHLGPGFERVRASAGMGLTEISLSLPLLSMADFTLDSRLSIVDAEISIDGFGPSATEVTGDLDISGTHVSGDSISAVFLGGPASARVMPAEEPGYRTVLEVRGELTAGALLDSFSMPFEDLLEGQTVWNGRLLLPDTALEPRAPLRVEIGSNLSGVALRFPEPLAKPPAEPTNLQLGFSFAGSNRLEVAGNLGATRRFALEFGGESEQFRFRRGAIALGGDAPVLPLRDGIVVAGRLPRLDLNDWLALAKNTSIDRARPVFREAELDIAEFAAFGQRLGTTRLAVERGDRVWNVDVESEAIAGRVAIPQDLSQRAPVIADMDRVYLAAGDNLSMQDSDPRDFPGLRLRAGEFGFGTRELGLVEADVVADPLGLRLTSFSSRSDSFGLEASGSWLRGPQGSMTRIAATASSSDVARTFEVLGLDAVIEGEMADLTASVYWDGPPSGQWLEHVNGDVGVRVETGSLVEIEPGAGRVLGLMSIAALPRRLALDFRDVFNRGFVFDEITGDFTIIDGNAYTDNLKLSGPSAEIGVIGRTGLRDRDYQQQAVVTAEPSKMLPTVGGLLGGAGVGAALLIFTRIFKEPLKGIGRASYCVTGSWDEPQVARITTEEAAQAEQCVALPDAMIEARND